MFTATCKKNRYILGLNTALRVIDLVRDPVTLCDITENRFKQFGV